MIEWVEVCKNLWYLKISGMFFGSVNPVGTLYTGSSTVIRLGAFETLDEAKLAVLHAAKQHLAEMLEAVKGELGE